MAKLHNHTRALIEIFMYCRLKGKFPEHWQHQDVAIDLRRGITEGQRKITFTHNLPKEGARQVFLTETQMKEIHNQGDQLWAMGRGVTEGVHAINMINFLRDLEAKIRNGRIKDFPDLLDAVKSEAKMKENA